MSKITAIPVLEQRPSRIDAGAMRDLVRAGLGVPGRPGVESLYIHVPFCVHKCHYCDFYSIVDTQDRQEAFTARLCRELAAWAPLSEGTPLRTIFVGGGTPSLLRVDLWRVLLAALAGLYDLSEIRDGRGEFTVECNPESVTPELLDVLAAGGVDRISMGAQSFNPHHLRTLERRHDPARVARALEIVRAAGIRRTSVDLIYAIPGQTPADWDRDLGEAIALGTEHVSCYNLTYEPATAMTARLARGEFTPADEDTEIEMFARCATRLEAAGFERYEISNYARRAGGSMARTGEARFESLQSRDESGEPGPHVAPRHPLRQARGASSDTSPALGGGGAEAAGEADAWAASARGTPTFGHARGGGTPSPACGGGAPRGSASGAEGVSGRDGIGHAASDRVTSASAQCRHNLAYWRQEQWLAVGPSAAAHVLLRTPDGTGGAAAGQRGDAEAATRGSAGGAAADAGRVLGAYRWKNVPRLDDYLSGDVDGFAPAQDVEGPDARRALVERIMTGLRLAEGLDAADVLARAAMVDAGAPARLEARVRHTIEVGHLDASMARAGRWSLTPAGLLVSNGVARTLARGLG